MIFKGSKLKIICFFVLLNFIFFNLGKNQVIMATDNSYTNLTIPPSQNRLTVLKEIKKQLRYSSVQDFLATFNETLTTIESLTLCLNENELQILNDKFQQISPQLILRNKLIKEGYSSQQAKNIIDHLEPEEIDDILKYDHARGGYLYLTTAGVVIAVGIIIVVTFIVGLVIYDKEQRQRESEQKALMLRRDLERERTIHMSEELKSLREEIIRLRSEKRPYKKNRKKNNKKNLCFENKRQLLVFFLVLLRSKFFCLCFVLFLIFGCLRFTNKKISERIETNDISRIVISISSYNPFDAKGSCGLNSLWKVLNRYDNDIQPDNLKNLISNKTKGYRDYELVSISRKLGFKSKYCDSNETELNKMLREKIPPIILVERDLERFFKKGFHWAVVFGKDELRREYQVDWGVDGAKEEISREDFLKFWRRSNYRAIYILEK